MPTTAASHLLVSHPHHTHIVYTSSVETGPQQHNNCIPHDDPGSLGAGLRSVEACLAAPPGLSAGRKTNKRTHESPSFSEAPNSLGPRMSPSANQNRANDENLRAVWKPFNTKRPATWPPVFPVFCFPPHIPSSSALYLVPEPCQMKASCFHVFLIAVLAACKGPREVVAFLPPTTALAGRGSCSSSSTASRDALLLLTPSSNNQQLPLGVVQAQARGAAARGKAPRLAAAREDCKSCMEADRLEEEKKRAASEEGDGGKGAAIRRAALAEVRFSFTCFHSIVSVGILAESQGPT